MRNQRNLRKATLGLPGWTVFALLAALALPLLGGGDAGKEGMLADLAAIDTSIELVKQELALDPGNAALQEELGYLTAEFHAISMSMGGDRPSCIGDPAPPIDGFPQRAESVAPPPPFCTSTGTPFTNSTPLAIPTGPAVVTSTLVVSGVDTYLWDLDLTTFLTHTFAADLDITLMSPAGTIVTITTDNGAGNDNVFNGTLWDDQADADGQVPYTSNNGLVTDQTYVNLTTATPLVPEENFGAFIGEDPNGTWTITISDDLGGDGGSLASWSLGVTTFPSAPLTTPYSFTNSTPLAVPTGPAVVTSTLAVAGAGTAITDLNLTTFLTHTFAADLDITLMSPAGTVVTITTDNGAGNDNVFNGTVWDDDANPAGQVPYTSNNGLVTDQTYVNLTTATPLSPEEAFAAFNGQDPNGTWTITISDDLSGDGGTLASWTLDITTGTCLSCTPITLSPATLPNGIVGTAYSQTVSASGGTAPYTYAVTVGALPTGLTLNPATGLISGTPTVVGPFAFTIEATDNAACTGSQAYSVYICPLISVAPAILPGGVLGAAYSQTVSASGGTAPYTYSVSAGALPGGLTLDPLTGAITGTITASGTFAFTITATDVNGCTGSTAYTIVIAAYNLTFFDDYGRAALCANSYTGGFAWSVFTGSGMGTYTGVARVTIQNNTLMLTSFAGDPWQLSFKYYIGYKRAYGSFIYRAMRVTSSLSDSLTTNDPPVC